MKKTLSKPEPLPGFWVKGVALSVARRRDGNFKVIAWRDGMIAGVYIGFWNSRSNIFRCYPSGVISDYDLSRLGAFQVGGERVRYEN